ncbi:MAG: hypothetical protein QM528_05755 [Phycisphaerales bacterium]|nr:hypothetical protein [Phycisphaerales bacterium]
MKNNVKNVGSILSRAESKEVIGSKTSVGNLGICPATYKGWPSAGKSDDGACDRGVGECGCNGTMSYVCGRIDGCCYNAAAVCPS